MQGIGFNMLIIGKPGSGKTTLLKNILLYHINKEYDRIIIMSPSILEYPFICFYKSEQLELEKIQDLCDKKTLLIIDDFCTELKKQSFYSQKIFFNRRHYGERLDIISTTQKYKCIPTFLRCSITHIILLNPSKFDVDQVYEEHIKNKKSYANFASVKFLLIDLLSETFFKDLSSEYLSNIIK